MSTTDRTLTAHPGSTEAAAVPRARFTPPPRPNVVRPRPGLRLAASIDRVLADPTADVAVAELTAGLAWTAALGETCLLTGAVADVRRGIAALRAGKPVLAVASLEAARADLPIL
ncbi:MULTISPECIES: hypothetical protein [Actinokineospora]|nr:MULTISPECIES: hypothetical protein [Actinokineospora]